MIIKCKFQDDIKIFFRLDPALIRPGRIDMQEYIGYCSQSQIENMYLRFYKGGNREQDALDSEKFAKEVIMKSKLLYKRPVSPAEIQGYFMLYKHSTLKELMDNVDKIWKGYKRSEKLADLEVLG